MFFMMRFSLQELNPRRKANNAKCFDVCFIPHYFHICPFLLKWRPFSPRERTTYTTRNVVQSVNASLSLHAKPVLPAIPQFRSEYFFVFFCTQIKNNFFLSKRDQGQVFLTMPSLYESRQYFPWCRGHRSVTLFSTAAAICWSL